MGARPGFFLTEVVVAWNNGGCEGNFNFEAAVRENSPVVQFSTGISCVSPMAVICSNFAALPTNSPSTIPSDDPTNHLSPIPVTGRA